MIKCNLAVLLAERGLKMSDIINDTPLSKTAVRGLFYNTSKGIQYETLEIICDYLKVEPGDVIQNIIFRYEIIEKSINDEESAIIYKTHFFYQDKEYIYDVNVAFRNYSASDFKKDPFASFELNMNIEYSDEAKRNIISQITELELGRFSNKLFKDFFETLNLVFENHEILNVLHNGEIL